MASGRWGALASYGAKRFDGTLRLLVNRTREPDEATAIRDRLDAQARVHLGLEITLLGGFPEDGHVAVAQRSRQAWSSVYPESDATALLVGVADALDAIDGGAAPARQTVTRFWKTCLEKIRAPLMVLQGANDPRVKIAESDQIVAAMQGKGLPEGDFRNWDAIRRKYAPVARQVVDGHRVLLFVPGHHACLAQRLPGGRRAAGDGMAELFGQVAGQTLGEEGVPLADPVVADRQADGFQGDERGHSGAEARMGSEQVEQSQEKPDGYALGLLDTWA